MDKIYGRYAELQGAARAASEGMTTPESRLTPGAAITGKSPGKNNRMSVPGTLFSTLIVGGLLKDMSKVFKVINKTDVGQNHADNKECGGNPGQGSHVKIPASCQSRTRKAFQYKGHKTACHIENGLQLSTLTGSNGSSTFRGDHAEEVLTELTVKNQDVENRMHISAKDETGKGAQVQENVGKRVKHFSKIAYLVVLSGKMAVQIVGYLRECQEWYKDADCYY